MPPAAPRSFPLWHLLTVAALCVLAYFNALDGEFLWDDEVQIVKNSGIRSLDNLGSAFTEPFWGFASGGGPNRTNFYRPVQTIGYALAYAAGGLDPAACHWLSLLLHVLATVFVYALAAELALPPAGALAAAAIFAVHPVHTEAVAWIAGLPDVACGAFYIAALWAFMRSERSAPWLWWTSAAGLYFAALLSKEMAVTFPLLALLLTFRPGAAGWTHARRAQALLPLAAVTVVYLVLRVQALGFLATTHNPVDAAVVDWITLGFRALGQYLWQAMVPAPLIAYHLVAPRLADRIPETLAALAFVSVAAAAAWRWRASLPQGLLWLAAFVLMLAPVFYFKGISNALVAERYLYIPSLAAVLVLGTVLTKLPGKNAALWSTLAIVGVFTVLTVARNRDWQSAERLYTVTLAAHPDIAHFQVNLSDIQLDRGDDARARQSLTAALATLGSTKYAQVPYDLYRAHIGMGALEARARNYDAARRHLETARQAYPDGEWPYLYLGGIAMEADGDYALAIEQLNTAVRLGPLNETARDYLGVALFNQGRFQEAAQQFQEALRINPAHREARAHWDLAMQELRKPQTPPQP